MNVDSVDSENGARPDLDLELLVVVVGYEFVIGDDLGGRMYSLQQRWERSAPLRSQGGGNELYTISLLAELNTNSPEGV